MALQPQLPPRTCWQADPRARGQVFDGDSGRGCGPVDEHADVATSNIWATSVVPYQPPSIDDIECLLDRVSVQHLCPPHAEESPQILGRSRLAAAPCCAIRNGLGLGRFSGSVLLRTRPDDRRDGLGGVSFLCSTQLRWTARDADRPLVPFQCVAGVLQLHEAGSLRELVHRQHWLSSRSPPQFSDSFLSVTGGDGSHPRVAASADHVAAPAGRDAVSAIESVGPGIAAAGDLPAGDAAWLSRTGIGAVARHGGAAGRAHVWKPQGIKPSVLWEFRRSLRIDNAFTFPWSRKLL